MDAHVDYQHLYRLQDAVLDIITQCRTGFYLTGGTCLNRFYASRRYSDDLDLFCSDPDLFRDYFREIQAALKRHGTALTTEIDTRDFIRLRLDDALKADFVNDRVFRYGRSQKSSQGFSIDNIINLLANKISALIGRDEPKDLFDIVTIHETEKIDWPFVLDVAGKKCLFERDYFLYRIQSFPLDLLDLLAVIKEEYRNECKRAVPLLVKDLERL